MLLFISDLHLQEDRPRLTRGFLDFLEGDATQAEALYILGDFFDVWIGDDAMTPFHQKIATSLKKLADQGTRIYLMHGNRDFLLGQDFCRQAGCQLLKDPCIIQPFSRPYLLSHGDLLCTDDVDYQRMRRILRNPLVSFILTHLPLRWRQKLARKARQTSQLKTRTKADRITEANPQAIRDLMASHQVTDLIHGHTHRPATHEFNLDMPGTDPQTATRYVLGDWSDDQGWKLEMTPDTLQLQAFSF
ncbi:UDP-2,3-diacylglucosamine diphosphatase [Marinospirillum perlucidum]|uniref:UDP-2,3-diacylglucosamine diphosphatase n=1 Tax=Marinospirillum perlucidum TaxID=1982602 RepID=UPI000DF42774|nr:UDP-2,3-diacylglucosamine diphosphatase [Marinospirillum perlucidum]